MDASLDDSRIATLATGLHDALFRVRKAGHEKILLVDPVSGDMRVRPHTAMFLGWARNPELLPDLCGAAPELEAIAAKAHPELARVLNDSTRTSVRPETRWQVGDLLDQRYQVLAVRAGGWGEVYILHEIWPQRTVAAKLCRIADAGPEAAQASLLRENLLWARVPPHPNIVETLGVASIGGVRVHLMEYVEGGTLRQWIREGRTTDDLSVPLTLALNFCDGMRHAYAHGIAAHGDIKPENCLITRDGVLKVSDLGCAVQRRSLITRLWAIMRRETADTFVGGTPQYMSPERVVQRLSLPKDVLRTVGMDVAAYTEDVRSDIYVFGAVLWEMVTGCRLFTLCEQHLCMEPPWDSISSSPLLPVLKRCLQKDPSQRFQSFKAMRSELARLYEWHENKPAPPLIRARALDPLEATNRRAMLSSYGLMNQRVVPEPIFRELERLATKSPRDYLDLHLKAFSFPPGPVGDIMNELCDSVGTAMLAGEWTDSAAGDSLAHVKTMRCIWRRSRILRPRFKPRVRLPGWYAIIPSLQEYLRADDELVEDLGHLCSICTESPDTLLSSAEKELKSDPQAAGAQLVKGAVLLKRGDLSEGLSCLTLALETMPSLTGKRWVQELDVSRTLVDAGAALLNRGDDKRALTCFTASTNIEPYSLPGCVGQAGALCLIGEADEALACCNRAILLDPRLSELREVKTHLLTSAESNKKKAHCGVESRLADRQQRMRAELIQRINSTFLTLGIWPFGDAAEAALKYARAERVRHARSGRAWLVQALAEAQQNNLDAAVTSLRTGLRKVRQPEKALWIGDLGAGDILVQHASELLEEGRLEEALRCYRETTQLCPENFDAWASRIRALATLERDAEILSCSREVLWHFEGRQAASLLWGMGCALEHLCAKPSALDCYEKATRADSSLHQAWAGLAGRYADLGFTERALECIEEAIRHSNTDPKRNELTYWYMKGWCLAGLDRLEESICAFDQAIQLNPRNAWAWNNRGTSLNALGRKGEARESFRRALEIAPDLAEARRNLNVKKSDSSPPHRGRR